MSAYERVNAANAAAARAAGWPELEGTSKQISWATTLRADKVREFNAACADMPPATRDHYREVLLREVRADVWIDHQFRPWQAILSINLTDDDLIRLNAIAGTDDRHT